MLDLKELRLSKGLRQEDVAKVVGVSRQQLSNVERKKIKPSVSLAKKLGEYFNVNWFEFYETEVKEEGNENVQEE